MDEDDNGCSSCVEGDECSSYWVTSAAADGGGWGQEEVWWLTNGSHGMAKWSRLTPLDRKVDGMTWREKKVRLDGTHGSSTFLMACA
jgi:hypothetical protein